jgi:hypothetical protein
VGAGFNRQPVKLTEGRQPLNPERVPGLLSCPPALDVRLAPCDFLRATHERDRALETVPCLLEILTSRITHAGATERLDEERHHDAQHSTEDDA